MIKCSRILPALCWAAACLLGQVYGACADTQTLAYITHNDGLIGQYQVGVSGGFTPLPTASVRTGAHPTRVVVDPKGRFAYVGSGTTKVISQFRINSAGALVPLSPADVKIKAIVTDLAIDNSGRALYALANAVILQFKINADGALTPMIPAKIDTGAYGRHIAVHPSKPYLYVTQKTGSVAQLRIGQNGALSPLKPFKMTTGGSAGSIAFSSDGRRAYVTRESDRSSSILQYDVQSNGALAEASKAAYFDDENGSTTIAVDPDRHSVFVSSDKAGYIYGFKLSAGHLEPSEQSLDHRITRDMRFVTRRQWTDDAEERLKDAEARVTTKFPDIRQRDLADARLNAQKESRSEIAAVYGITTGPDGAMYMLNSSGVARFGISTTGELADGPWASTWPDEIVNGTPIRTHATSLTFVRREPAEAK